MFRSHGTDVPREIYNFGGKGDWAYDAQEKFINLRYRLLPYIYSTAWSVTSGAATMMRALAMDFAGDKKVWDINNEYLFGKSFLVCPVTEPSLKTQTSYLPEGTGWIDFWTGEKLAGGQSVSRSTPIETTAAGMAVATVSPANRPR